MPQPMPGGVIQHHTKAQPAVSQLVYTKCFNRCDFCIKNTRKLTYVLPKFWNILRDYYPKPPLKKVRRGGKGRKVGRGGEREGLEL